MTQTWIEEFSFAGAFLLWVKIRNPSLLLKHRCPIALTYQGGRIQISAFTSLFRFSMRKISGSKASWLLPWPNIWVFFISSLSFKKMFPVVAKEISFFVASQLLFPSGLYSRRLFPLVSVLLMRWTSFWDSRVVWFRDQNWIVFISAHFFFSYPSQKALTFAMITFSSIGVMETLQISFIDLPFRKSSF